MTRAGLRGGSDDDVLPATAATRARSPPCAAGCG